MTWQLRWKPEARRQYDAIRDAARHAWQTRQKAGRTKSSRQEGLCRQVRKTLRLLFENPRHPGLQTHEFRSLPHPYKKGEKVFEAYAQQHTPGAYRVFWCYGPKQGEITIVTITPHP